MRRYLSGVLVPIPFRAVIWTMALLWMGMACILNGRDTTASGPSPRFAVT